MTITRQRINKDIVKRLVASLSLSAAFVSVNAAELLPVDESCTVTILNRTVQVSPNGGYSLPNVPSTQGQIRARVTCVDEAGLTTSGQTEYFTVTNNGLTEVGPFMTGDEDPIPTLVQFTHTGNDPDSPATPNVLLSGAGTTFNLAVTATFADDSTLDVSLASSGINYTSSNTDIITITENGLLTSVNSGVVLITARKDGVLATMQARSLTSGDTDNDGLPDDFELANGLNPNDPVDAFEDQDMDGLSALDEFNLGTDLNNNDSDNDGLDDGEEVTAGDDGFITNPLLDDTDGDGIRDQLEITVGTDPTDAASFDLASSLASISVNPQTFDITYNTLEGEASLQLIVTGLLSDGFTINLTATGSGTNYSSNNLSRCGFGARSGQIFVTDVGVCEVTVSNSGYNDIATLNISSFAPQAVSNLPLGAGIANNVDVKDDYVYVATNTGLVIVDVFDRTFPSVVATYPTGNHANDVKVIDNLAFVAAESQGLLIIDISIPDTPSLIGQINSINSANDVAIRGERAYVATSTGLKVIDISVPSVPLLLGDSFSGNTIGVDVNLDTNVAVLAAGTNDLQLIDISDETLPVIISTLSGGNVQDVVIRDDYVFLADIDRSLTSVYIGNPANPTIQASTGITVGGRLYDLTLFDEFAFGADVVFVNSVPIINIAVPDIPTPLVQVVFPGDTTGFGIAADTEYFYMSAQNGTLYIGQYRMSFDSDRDGLTNQEESQLGTDPSNPDSDGDGLEDAYESNNNFDPLNPDDAAGDADADGLSNLDEQANGTDPRDTDTDNDGLSDGEEVNTYNTNPTRLDTDSDGIDDGTEIADGSDPLDPAGSNPYIDAVLEDNPIAYWRFEESSGTIASDISGNSYDGTFTNSPVIGIESDIADGLAIELDGDNDFIELGSIDGSDPLALANSAFTLEAWIKPDLIGDQAQRIIDKSDNGGAANGYSMAVDVDGSLLFLIDSNNYKTEPGVVTAGKWQHVVMVNDTDLTTRIYINGREIDASFVSGGPGNAPAVSTNMRLGSWNHSTAREYIGKLDEVAIYNSPLTLARIRTHYLLGKLGREEVAGYEDLVNLNLPAGFWRFEETSGIVAIDSSGNDLDGLYVNNPALGQSSELANGLAVSFDGVNQYVEIPDDNSLDFGPESAMSIAFWFKASEFRTISHLIGKREGCGTQNYQIARDNGLLHFNSNGGRVNAGVDITVDKLTQMVVTYDGVNTLQIYIDGENVATNTNYTLQTVNAASLLIGASGSCGDTFAGSIDEVTVFGSALDASDVKRQYQITKGLLGYWSFNKITGSDLPDLIGEQHGTLMNGVEIYDGAVVNDGPLWIANNVSPSPNNKNYGLALQLNNDGQQDDYVDVGDLNTFDFGKNDFTFSGWFRIDTLNTDPNQRHYLIHNGVAGQGGFNVLIAEGNNSNAGKLGFEINGPSSDITIWSDSNISQNQWHWFAAEVSGETMSLYVDGVLQSQTASYSAEETATPPEGQRLSFGNSGNGFNSFNGTLDDFVVFNKSLTTTLDFSDTLTSGELYDLWQNGLENLAGFEPGFFKAVAINSNTTISASDASRDFSDLTVDGATVTIEGAHNFREVRLQNGASITHTQGSNDAVNLVIDSLIIPAGTSIDVSEKGRDSNGTPGSAGGSYGGRGGFSGASALSPYGNTYEPVDLGTGGTGTNSFGGGAIKILTNNLVLDGVIRSNGTNGVSNGRNGGSGGSIWIEAVSISGSGLVQANGGNRGGQTGGGGGRIAMYYDVNNGFDLYNNVEARGSSHSTGSTREGAQGSVYYQDRILGQSVLRFRGYSSDTINTNWSGPVTDDTELQIEQASITISGNIAGASFNWLDSKVQQFGSLDVANMTLTNSTYTQRIGNYSINGRGGNLSLTNSSFTSATVEQSNSPVNWNDITLASNSVLTHQAVEEADYATHKGIDWVANTVSIDVTSTIDVTGKGKGRDGSTGGSGGSYGGFGGFRLGPTNNPYGSYLNPDDLGTGGDSNTTVGGGAVKLVANSIVLDGSILSNGTGSSSSENGGASGGSVWIDSGDIGGSGRIEVNGGSGSPAHGGGGRVAIYYDTNNGFDLYNNVEAIGFGAGNTSWSGSPGTVYYENKITNAAVLRFRDISAVTRRTSQTADVPESTELQIENARVRLTGDVADDVLSFTGSEVEIRGDIDVGALSLTNTSFIQSQGTLTGRSGDLILDNSSFSSNTVDIATANVNWNDITLINNSVLSHQAVAEANYATHKGIDWVANTVIIDATSAIDLTGKGKGPDGGLTGSSGGSYGGGGHWRFGQSNPPYGSASAPDDFGTGGVGTLGGGAIKLTASNLQLSGAIRSNGSSASGSNGPGGGSGGSVWLILGDLSGAGLIQADGGNGAPAGAGGGRVAIYYDTLTGFDLINNLTVSGSGSGIFAGTNGSIRTEDTTP